MYLVLNKFRFGKTCHTTILFHTIRFLRDILLQRQTFGSAGSSLDSDRLIARDPLPSTSASDNFTTIISPTTTINDLNDDCLRELFTKLTISELCKMSIVCKRFRLIIESILQSELKSIDLSDRSKMGRSNSHKGYELAPMRALFKRYQIVELAFSKCDFINVSDYRIINMISRYCPELKSIHFKGISFSFTNDSDKLRAFFKQLTSVTLERCFFDGFRNTIIPYHLKVLYQISFINLRMTYFKFPNAEKLIIRGGVIGSLLSERANQLFFFENHQNIKHLEIDGLDLSIWRKCLPNLVVLKTEISFSSSITSADLPCFDNLKDLTLNEVDDPSHPNIVTLLTAISARNVLERLEFGTSHLNIDYL